MKETKLTLAGEEMFIIERTYMGGAPALQVMSLDGPFMTITVNVEGYMPPEGHVLVKTWSENEPYREELLKSGLFEDTGQRVPTGFVQAEVWKYANA